MFIEGSFSWDKQGERTSLEWPPLMSPDVAEARSRGPAEEESVLGTDPDLTAAEVHARDAESLVSAAFLAEDLMSLTASGGAPANEGQAAPLDRDGTDRWLDEAYEDEGERPPRRHLWTRKGSFIVFGTAVTVALSGGYAAQAFGWRLPPTLRESAQPMREFLWSLAPSRLVDLMATEDRPARPLAPDHHEVTGPTSDRAQPMPPAAESRSASTTVPSETEESVAAVPPSQVVDPRDRHAWVDRDAPDSEAVVATSTALAAGQLGQLGQSAEQPANGGRAARSSALAPPRGIGRADHSGTAGLAAATRAAPVPANRDRLARAWHGFVWSPAAQGLVPAVPAIEDQSKGALPPAASAAVPVR